MNENRDIDFVLENTMKRNSFDLNGISIKYLNLKRLILVTCGLFFANFEFCNRFQLLII